MGYPRVAAASDGSSAPDYRCSASGARAPGGYGIAIIQRFDIRGAKHGDTLTPRRDPGPRKSGIGQLRPADAAAIANVAAFNEGLRRVGMRFLNRPLGDMYALAFPKEPCSGATPSKSADPALMRWSRASSNERSSFRSAGSGHSSLSKASSTPIASAMPENVYATDQPKLCGSKD